MSDLSRRLLAWFDREARDLPWRDTDAWGVMVSEYMLQQTPVNRVLPVWQEWRERWPTPDALAAEPASEAIRAWGRLGYPRRAQRLHAAATIITEQHAGQVPRTVEELRALPGIGDYTAAAIMAFAFDEYSVVLDTNIRRVIARAISGVALPQPHVTNAERELAESLIPRNSAPTWNAAIMELGALICTANSPNCTACPWLRTCLWHSEGMPRHEGVKRTQPKFEGSDRQARGAIMAILRASDSVTASAIEKCWSDDEQRERALASLIKDGLIKKATGTRYSLA